MNRPATPPASRSGSVLRRERQEKASGMVMLFADSKVGLTSIVTVIVEAEGIRIIDTPYSATVDYLAPGEDAVVVRCRIDGVLREIMSCPLNQFPAIASRIKLIGGLNIAESRLPQDGRTNVKLGHEELDMRISTLPILTGESIVLRLLNQDALTFDLKTHEIVDKFTSLTFPNIAYRVEF